MILQILLACSQTPDVFPEDSGDPEDEGCSIALSAAEFADGEAANRVVWSLSGSAATVTAEASWYDGGVVSTTTYALSGEDSGVVSFLPYATSLNLQERYGTDIALTLTAHGADGQARCSWSDSVPFFTPDWEGNIREVSSFSVADPQGVDRSLADTYLLMPQSTSSEPTVKIIQVMLYTAVGDVVGSYSFRSDSDGPLSEQGALLVSGADLRKGRLHMLTEGVPGLTTSIHCQRDADSRRSEDCINTNRLLHHGLFLNDSGTAAFSSEWQHDADGVTAVALPTRRELDAEGDVEVLFDLDRLLGIEMNYENSFTRSPLGAQGIGMACTTDHITFPAVGGQPPALELGVCFEFTGETLHTDRPLFIVNDANAEGLREFLAGTDYPVRVLGGGAENINGTDFLHDLKVVWQDDHVRVFVYNLGYFDPVRVRVYDFFGAEEGALRCTAELPDDDATLFYGSVVLPRVSTTIFGAYAATNMMDLRWFDVDNCAEIATMLSSDESGTGQWLTTVDASEIYPPEAREGARVVSHQVTYHTVNWATD